MEHRGEDASRTQAGWGSQPPWDGDDAGQGQPEHSQHDDYGQPGYERRPAHGYDRRRSAGGGSAGGGYSGGYKGQDAGNDWYGGQPGAASGASFADTGAYPLSGQFADEYGTGPSQARRDPVRGYPPSFDPSAPGQPAQAQPRGRPFPGPVPPASSGPMAAPRTGPQSAPYTGQQERYDDYDYGGRGYDADGTPAGQRGYPGSRGRRGGRRESVGLGRADGRRPLLLAAGAVAAVIIVGIAAYVFLVKPRPAASSHATAGPLPTSGSAPSTQACVKKYGTYCHIEASNDDPVPLTISELFPPAFTNDSDRNSFSLVSTKLDKTCSNAVIGQALISALKAGKCTQVVRASYVSGNGKIMGTIGVVNLATTNQAHHAGKVVGQSDFIAPLAAAKGVAKKLGQGTGVVEAEFKGHYLILTWLEFTNGTTPSTKAQDSELEQFSSDLVAGTANIPLSQRMVTGTPATSGAASP